MRTTDEELDRWRKGMGEKSLAQFIREAVEEKLAGRHRLPEAGDLGVGERPADRPKRERRDPRSAGRVAHERGARGGGLIETDRVESGTNGPEGETVPGSGETNPAGGETVARAVEAAEADVAPPGEAGRRAVKSSRMCGVHKRPGCQEPACVREREAAGLA